MTLSETAKVHQGRARFLHQMLMYETDHLLRKLKKNPAHSRKWWNQTERARAKRSAEAREALFALLG